MHNEGAPRHHAGAPGPLLYLKPRSEQVGRRAPRIRSPGSGSAEKPPPRQPWSRALQPRRAAASPRASPTELGGARAGRPRAEGEGAGEAGPREGGQRRTQGQEAARCESRAVRRGAEPGRKERPRVRRARTPPASPDPRRSRDPPQPGAPCTPGTARSCSFAAAPRPAAPRGASERLPPPPPGSQPRALGAGAGADPGGSRRPPQPEQAPTFSARGTPGSGAHGFMKTLMQEVGRTWANFCTLAASAAPRASSPRPASPGGRRCPRW